MFARVSDMCTCKPVARTQESSPRELGKPLIGSTCFVLHRTHSNKRTLSTLSSDGDGDGDGDGVVVMGWWCGVWCVVCVCVWCACVCGRCVGGWVGGWCKWVGAGGRGGV